MLQRTVGQIKIKPKFICIKTPNFQLANISAYTVLRRKTLVDRKDQINPEVSGEE